MESKFKICEKQIKDEKQKIDNVKSYNDILQHHIKKIDLNKETISVDSTSEFDTTNCMFL